MKRKESRKQVCEKCNDYFYSHSHHILPKADFGDGERADLCPNCHTDFHEYLNKANIEQGDTEQHLYVWYKWYYGVIAIGLFVSVYFLA